MKHVTSISKVAGVPASASHSGFQTILQLLTGVVGLFAGISTLFDKQNGSTT